MKQQILKSVAIALVAITVLSFTKIEKWIKAGSDPLKYEMGLDPSLKETFTIKTINNDLDENSFGTYMSKESTSNYLGKRIQLTGLVKSSIESGWAGLWLRNDGKDRSESLGFDNMYDRQIKDETGWKSYSVVLDIPTEAISMSYGALLVGKGQIWFKDVSNKVVDTSVPVTAAN